MQYKNNREGQNISKVPEVTLAFWIVKIIATTLGETGGDAVSMSLELGYIVATAIFTGIFIFAVLAQVLAKGFYPSLYWTTIIATTTVGTTLADFVDRSQGVGYAGGSLLLFSLLIISLTTWRYSEGSISVQTVNTRRVEIFYWVTIMFSQTLGTALGDWTADSVAYRYIGSAVIFSTLLAIIGLCYYFTNISRTILFWSAFILTRPLGAVLGDFLDKPIYGGGLNLSRYAASLWLLTAIIGYILFSYLVNKSKEA
jgi:uncharacterized membrane-anchored protein